MAEPKWGGERREGAYDAPVYGLPVKSLYRPGQPIPKRGARTQGPKRPRSIAPPKITGANEQEIAAKKQEIIEAVRVTAGFLALRGRLTMDAAQHNLDAELGPFILQEATIVALQAATPANVIMRQRARLAETAREMLDTLMNTPLSGDSAMTADMPSGE